MKFVLDNRVTLEGISHETENHIKQQLTLLNPKFQEAQRMGRYTGNISEKLMFYSADENKITCPRGFSDRAYRICRHHESHVDLVDNRRVLPEIGFAFKGDLRDYQSLAVSEMIRHTHGTLSAPTGSGKTVMALAVIARRRQPALIIVHTRELLNQWIRAIGRFLDIPSEKVGVIGGGKFKPGGSVSVGLVQTLKNKWSEVVENVGHVIVDECHKCPAKTFTDVVTRFDAKYFLGLSATPWRRDRLTPSIYFHLGEQRWQVPRERLFEEGSLVKPRVVFRETLFETQTDPGRYYSLMMQELTRDTPRNQLICRDIASDETEGIKLVLSDRREHCRALSRMLEMDFGCKPVVLTGGTPVKEREESITCLRAGSTGILISTISLLSEGFDLPQLSTLFLTTPIRFSGRLMQCLGRILRPSPGKDRATVYDYVDVQVGVLANAAASRERVYDTVTGGDSSSTVSERGA